MEQLRGKKMKGFIFLFIVFQSCLGQKLLSDSELSKVDNYTSIESALESKQIVYKLDIKNNNQFTSIPNEVFRFKNLQVLKFTGSWCDIDSCINIKEIPRDLDLLENLEELYLVSNELKTLPKEINNLKHLKVLDLSENIEINLKKLNNLNLKELHLNGCSLRTLPENIFKLKELQILGLEGNFFQSNEIQRIRSALPDVEIYF